MALNTRRAWALRLPKVDVQGLREVLSRERSKPVLTRTAAFLGLGALGTAWVPFYPAWMVVFLAVILAGISLRFPVLSLILLSVLASAAAGYQRPEFGLVMIVATLLISIAALFDWKFAFLVLASLFLSRAGLGYLPPMMGAFLFPAFTAIAAMAVSGVLMTLVLTLGNFDILGYLVSAPHASSLVIFNVPPSATFAPTDIGASLGRILEANPDVLGSVLSSNLGASLLPYVQVVLWCVAVYLVAVLAKRKASPRSLALVTVAGGGLLVATFLGSAWIAGVALDGLGAGLSFTILAAVGGGAAFSWDARERFHEYFVARDGLAHVGTRIADTPDARRATFRSVGGLSDVKADLKESILIPLRHPDLAQTYGVSAAKGILLFGPPGCGKTLLMTALAGELHVEMFEVKASDIMSKWYGESEAKIDQLFRVARERRPCIVFIDDIDAIAKSRDLYAGDDVTPRLLGMILAEIDGMDKVGGMVMVGTTNKPELVDSALLRPGRFDKIIYVPPPDPAERKEVLEVHLRGRPRLKGLDLAAVAARTDRFSGADLANVVNEAARMAMNRSLETKKPEPIRQADLEAVLPHVRPSITLSMVEEYERLRLGYERKMHHLDRAGTEEILQVAGLDELQGQLRSTIDLAVHRQGRLEEFSLRPARGILLFGPSGCGKTHLMRRAAADLGIPVQTLSVPSLLTSSEPAAEMKRTFYLARENPPAIILLDDLDLLASRDERSPTTRNLLSRLLSLLEAIGPTERVVLVGTTNRPDILDPGILGPGRLDKVFYVPPPDAAARAAILSSRLEGVPSDRITADLVRSLAERTEGYSSGDLLTLVDEAKLTAIREDAPLLYPEHLEKAQSRVRPTVTLESIQRCLEFAKRRNLS